VLHCRFSDGCSCAVAASQPPAPPTTTPLLEALKAEKSAQKDKEAILRNHAHYKDSAAVNASRKEEVKKKAPPATVAPQKPEPGPAPLSRKAKKAAAAQKVGSPAQTARATPAAKGVSVEGANLPAKPLPHVPAVRTTPRSPRTARQQAPKVPAAASLPPKPTTQPVPSASAEAGSPAPSANIRKGRPVVGLGRQFEAALNGAVGPGGGRRREREAQPSPASEVVRKDVPGKLKDVSSPSLGVPNILQRGDGHAPGSPVIMQRPQPIRVPEAAAVDPQPGRGGPPRRGRGRGRGAPAPRGG
jgi:regulator of nonsense transcripts 3